MSDTLYGAPYGRDQIAIGPDEPSGLRRVRNFAARRWPVIGLTLAVVLVTTSLALDMVRPRYTAHAEILLDARREKTFGPDDTLRLISLDSSDIESAVVTIKSNALLSRVVTALHLDRDRDFGGAPQSSSWLAALRPQGAPEDPKIKALATLARSIRVERLAKAYALSISATATQPSMAARLANAIADAFVQDQREAHLESSRRAATFFADRLAPLGDHLRQSEDALERFRHEHDLIAKTATPAGGVASATLNEQQLAELNTRLAGAKAETAQALARYEQVRKLQDGGGSLEALPNVIGSSLIAQLRQQQAEVGRKEADLAARYTESYPLLLNARAERRDIERSIAREVARIVANLKEAWEVSTLR